MSGGADQETARNLLRRGLAPSAPPAFGCDDKHSIVILTISLAMEPQYPQQQYGAPPAFPETPNGPRISSERGSFDIDITNGDDDRARRGTSVLSGMSIEDMEAAETLNSLSGRE